jgi:hypothetical protein
MFEHAPSESAMRAAALEREIDALGGLAAQRIAGAARQHCLVFFTGMRGSRCSASAETKRHSAVQPPSIDRLAPVIALAASEQR